jgi:hypothetical protein
MKRTNQNIPEAQEKEISGNEELKWKKGPLNMEGPNVT